MISLLVLLGAVWYFTTPQERERFRRTGLGALDQMWGGASRYWPARQPFDAALDARTPHPVVTLAIVALNVGIFLSMVFGAGSLSDPNTILGWGGNAGIRTANGEWWRLATAIFVHASFLHLVANIAGLVQIGLITERFFGRVAVASAFLGAGLLFGVLTVLVHPVEVSGGATAGVFAIYGMFATMVFAGLRSRSVFTVPLTTFLKIAPSAALFFLYSLAAGRTTWLELSGLLVGVAYGFALATAPAAELPTLQPTMDEAGDAPAPAPAPIPTIPVNRIASVSAAVAIVVIAAGIPVRGVIDVRPEISRIAEVEDKTASAYDVAVRQFTNGELTLKELVAVIERTILPELRSAQARLKQLQHVPREQTKLVAEANQYFKLRQESWQARAAGLRRTSLKGMRSPDDTEREARQLLDNLRSENP